MAADAWGLARKQLWVLTRSQLLDVGFSPEAIDHRIEKGRLRPIHRGVYLVGNPQITPDRRFIAAVLACGAGAALSGLSAAALLRVRPARPGASIEVSVPTARHPHPAGIVIHRRTNLEVTRHRGIPVTTPTTTLLDLASRLPPDEVERAVNEAVNRDLIDLDTLRAALAVLRGRRGARKLARILDKHTYVMTDTVLEQRFLRIVRAAGLPLPLTQVYVNGHRVDFYWPELGLVVETDGLRFHRTPAQQAADAARDQDHVAAGLVPLRFSHGQIFYEPGRVEEMLRAVAARLRAATQPA